MVHLAIIANVKHHCCVRSTLFPLKWTTIYKISLNVTFLFNVIHCHFSSHSGSRFGSIAYVGRRRKWSIQPELETPVHDAGFFIVTSLFTYLKINSAGPECRFNHIIRNGKQFIDIAEDNYELCGISPAVTQGITYLVVNPAVFPHSRLESHDIQTQFNLAGLFGRILTLECSHSHVFCLTSCAITPSRATRVVSLNRPLSLQSGMTQRQRSLVLITRHSRSGCTTHVRLHLSIIGWKLTSIKIQHPGSWHDGKYLAVFHDRRRWLGK